MFGRFQEVKEKPGFSGVVAADLRAVSDGDGRFVCKVSRFFQDLSCRPNRQFPNAAWCGLRPESAVGTPRQNVIKRSRQTRYDAYTRSGVVVCSNDLGRRHLRSVVVRAENFNHTRIVSPRPVVLFFGVAWRCSEASHTHPRGRTTQRQPPL